jgi:signal transduction histidine kinase/ActR/RegA family two-component response regulator
MADPISQPPARPLRSAWLVGLAIFVVASTGLLVSYRVSHNLLLNSVKTRLKDLVTVVAAEIDPGLHATISSSAQVGSLEYRQATEPLLQLRNTVSDIHFAYTLRQGERGLYYVLDSTSFLRRPRHQSDVVVVGQLYSDAPPAAQAAATTGRTTVSASPTTDQWGTFLSSFAPIKDGDGNTIGVVGIDFSLATINRKLEPLRLTLGLLLVGSALLSSLVGVMVWRSEKSRNKAIKKILEARNRARDADTKWHEASHAKESFLTMMNHEMRTPLNGILGLTNILLNTKLTTEQHTCLQTVKNSGEALLGQLNSLLDFAAIEASAVVVDVSPVAIKALLDEVLALFAESANAKGLDAAIQMAPGIPAVVLTDPSHLRQILEQLMGNAVKFSSGGTIELAVSCQAPLSDGTLPMVFQVHNAGGGLSNQASQRLFQPFYQEDPSNTQSQGGLGLGLAICRGLVTAMGGTIDVDSDTRRGTTVLVTIPVIPTKEPAIAAAELPEGPQPISHSFAADHPLRILLVDDNPVNIRVCELMLGRLGYTVTIACDGQEAIDQQQVLDPDLILMDVRMPKLDGLEATRRIRGMAGNANRPWIAAVTANSRESDRAEALNSGMNDFISKPIRAERLRSVLRRAHEAIHA